MEKIKKGIEPMEAKLRKHMEELDEAVKRISKRKHKIKKKKKVRIRLIWKYNKKNGFSICYFQKKQFAFLAGT